MNFICYTKRINFKRITKFIAVLSLILFSCNKKEIFSPDRYIETESIQLGAADMEIYKRFTYSNKKQLTSVWLKNGNATLTFEYNKDKTIKKITSTEDKGVFYALLFYENKLVKRIEYYENNQLARESIFSRKAKKNTINKIESYVYDGFADKNEGALSDLLFEDAKKMPKSMRKMHKSGEKSLYAVQDITYENDNISRVRLSYANQGNVSVFSTTSYTYDDKKNPFYGLPYAFLNLTGYSKNNEKYTRTSYENDEFKTMITIDNSYSYEKKYPTHKTVVESNTYITGKDGEGNYIWATDVQHSSYKYTYK